MRKQLKQVTMFHRQIGETVSQRPVLLQHDEDLDRELSRSLRQTIETFSNTDLPRTQLTRRALMAIEELAEWIEAHSDNDLVAAADAWADRMYVLLGDAVATGLPAEELLDEVHRSNMTKAATNADSGKGTKSDSFEPPDIAGVLNHVSTRRMDA